MSENHALKSIPTKILLPIDFSPSSKTALEIAADLALHFHAELFLVNVIPFITQLLLPNTLLPRFSPSRRRRHALSTI